MKDELQLAIESNNYSKVQTILSNEAIKLKADHMFYAMRNVKMIDTKISYALLNKFDDFNIQNYGGATFLHFAAGENQPDLVRYLLNRGAKHVESKSGKTPLDIAKKRKLNDVIHILRMHIAPEDPLGYIPLLFEETKERKVEQKTCYAFDIEGVLVTGSPKNVNSNIPLKKLDTNYFSQPYKDLSNDKSFTSIERKEYEYIYNRVAGCMPSLYILYEDELKEIMTNILKAGHKLAFITSSCFHRVGIIRLFLERYNINLCNYDFYFYNNQPDSQAKKETLFEIKSIPSIKTIVFTDDDIKNIEGAIEASIKTICASTSNASNNYGNYIRLLRESLGLQSNCDQPFQKYTSDSANSGMIESATSSL
ncbi:ankyrin repeat domain-containing protein [Thiotrichales bacterium 19S9-12]|nr:ankyrin repeat domain-containing protein [Thiotrichales bacterium 19S9-11]MCF6812354.1 ankyrin repeat domain-containing protein [Thiotrichales bacterium 19S9-12]